jgi:P4 family phage/plasmid primase-like protien
MFSRPNAKIIPPRPSNVYAELALRFGEPYLSNGRGGFQVNQMFFVRRFAVEHLILHEPNERDFYTYDETNGVWVPQTSDSIKATMAADWQRYPSEIDEPGLLPLRTNGLLDSLVSLLRGHVEKIEPFKKTRRIIHLQNGMLHLDHEGAQLHEFSPDYYSRNVCPIPWDPDAGGPRFISELLESALDPEDVSLLQRWCGSLLLGRNLAQRIVLLVGTAGGGKSTLLEIIEAVIGPANVCQLRTEHLNDRFEISRFLRKTMLSGKDVLGDFLMKEGAHVLKALVGHDLLSAERKGSNAEFQVRGEFGVAISCNSRLRVKLDGDVDAWRRRFLMVRYEKPKPKERILDFAKTLLSQEASGILKWMVDGAIMHLRECDSVGDYDTNDDQKDRVDQLLAESDSIRHFVTERIRPECGADLTVTEIVSAYFDYCSEKGWVAFGSNRVARDLPDLMLETFRSTQNTHIERGGKRQRGYPGVSFIPS